MDKQSLIIHCSLATFFENHVDFDHFEEVHGNYSDPTLLECGDYKNSYFATYSLRYGKWLKQTIIYRYTVTKIHATKWQGIIDTRYLGIDCRIFYEGFALKEGVDLRIKAQVSSLLLPNNVCRSLSKQAQKLIVAECYRDKYAIEHRPERFPKPALTQNDEALKLFRTFAQQLYA